jgi:hypothetical protein
MGVDALMAALFYLSIPHLGRQSILGYQRGTCLFKWTDIQKIDHATLHIANGQNKVLFDF